MTTEEILNDLRSIRSHLAGIVFDTACRAEEDPSAARIGDQLLPVIDRLSTLIQD